MTEFEVGWQLELACPPCLPRAHSCVHWELAIGLEQLVVPWMKRQGL
jgi:hypothetical protein